MEFYLDLQREISLIEFDTFFNFSSLKILSDLKKKDLTKVSDNHLQSLFSSGYEYYQNLYFRDTIDQFGHSRVFDLTQLRLFELDILNLKLAKIKLYFNEQEISM